MCQSLPERVPQARKQCWKNRILLKGFNSVESVWELPSQRTLAHARTHPHPAPSNLLLRPAFRSRRNASTCCMALGRTTTARSCAARWAACVEMMAATRLLIPAANVSNAKLRSIKITSSTLGPMIFTVERRAALSAGDTGGYLSHAHSDNAAAASSCTGVESW